MQSKRAIWVGLLILAGFGLVPTQLSRKADEPAYQGKSVSVWFQEFAYSSNAPPAPVQVLSMRVKPDGSVVVMQRNAAGNVVMLNSPTNPAARAIWLQQQMSSPQYLWRDPSLQALQALGSNAVPHLVAHLGGNMFDQAYKRVFTNLPALLQRKLPDPRQSIWLRARALNALSQLGEPARDAAPRFLPLLKQRDPFLRSSVLAAVRTLHVDRHLVTPVLLQLGSKRRYQEVVEIADQTGWEGEEMAELLGTILKSPDPALRRQAMALLERSGTAASPQVDGIIRALGDSDAEVRYLAVRSLEVIGTNSPQVTNALIASLKDENNMVQTVARRTLSKIAPETVP